MKVSVRSVFLWVMVLAGVVGAWGQTRIKAGDTLRLMCAEEPTLNRNYLVNREGLILVQFLGAVKVVDLTEAEAAAQIKRQLETEKIVPKATVTVEIARLELKMVKFEGAVRLEAETPWRQGLRLSDVMRLAEPTATTDLTRVTIVGEDGARQTVDYSVADLQTNVNNPLIKAGDRVIFVAKGSGNPPTTDPGTKPPTGDPGTTPPTNPPAASKVEVLGEVVLAGSFDFSAGMTVREALLRAGGFGADADSSKVTLVRNGVPTDLRLPGDADYRLAGGDRLTVGKRTATTPPVTPPTNPGWTPDPLPPGAAVVVTGSVKEPGRILMTPGMTLSQAIEAAGGFVDGARKDRIVILTPNNVKPRTMNFRDIELRYTGDVLLKPGQTIEIDGPQSPIRTFVGGGGLLGQVERERILEAVSTAWMRSTLR